jgi:F-type H+-transporting ATPase subunit delta
MDPIAVDRYVQALFNVAKNASQEQVIEEDLVSLKKEIRRSGLKSFLENPRYPFPIKIRTIETIGEMFSSNFTASFLRILLVRHRIGLLEQIVDCYIKLHRETKRIAMCDLLFATQPSQDFLNLVEKELKRITHMDIELQVRVDPAVLGGVRLKYKNYVFDGTYRKRLESMKDRLLEGQYT